MKRAIGLEKRYRFLLAEAARSADRYERLKAVEEAKTQWLRALAIAGLPLPDDSATAAAPEKAADAGTYGKWLAPEKGQKSLDWQPSPIPRTWDWEPKWGDSLRRRRADAVAEKDASGAELARLEASMTGDCEASGRRRILAPYQGGAAAEKEARTEVLDYSASRILRLTPPLELAGKSWRLWQRSGNDGKWRQTLVSGEGPESVARIHFFDDRVDYAFLPSGTRPDDRFRAYYSFRIDTVWPELAIMELSQEASGALVVSWEIKDEHMNGNSVSLRGSGPKGELFFAENGLPAKGSLVLDAALRRQDIAKIEITGADLAGHEIRRIWEQGKPATPSIIGKKAQ